MPASSTASSWIPLRDQPSGVIESRRRLWLEFVNTDASTQGVRGDLLRDFEALVSWLGEQHTSAGGRCAQAAVACILRSGWLFNGPSVAARAPASGR